VKENLGGGSPRQNLPSTWSEPCNEYAGCTGGSG
jgi:hypothetical protein